MSEPVLEIRIKKIVYSSLIEDEVSLIQSYSVKITEI